LRATTRGTGELIAAAIEAGASSILVGVGGSATTDGGQGALEALAMTPFQTHGVLVEVACDVQTMFVDAASIFAPQKGASNDQVAALSVRLEMLAEHYKRELGIDVTAIPGSGGAGGLAGGLAALGAKLAPGFDLVADIVGLDDALGGADLIITGEGAFDQTSLSGKVVGGVLRRATKRHLPTAAIVGEALAQPPEPLLVVSLVQEYGRERALADTATCIAEATTALLHRTGL
jgi:glycerate kinase